MFKNAIVTSRSSLRLAVLAAITSIFLSCGQKETETAQSETESIALPSLQARLDEKKAQFEQNASSEIVQVFNEGEKAVAASGVLETALNVGDTAPDFTLPNATGQMVTLSEILKKGPVVLIWYRGGW
jgi:hypothetical protein